MPNARGLKQREETPGLRNGGRSIVEIMRQVMPTPGVPALPGLRFVVGSLLILFAPDLDGVKDAVSVGGSEDDECQRHLGTILLLVTKWQLRPGN